MAPEHWDGRHFFNPGVPPQRFSTFLRWIRTRKPGVWRRFVATEPGPKPPPRVPASELRVTFVGHATVLLQTEGFNFLTDPVWSERASPLSFAGPKRHRDPGIRFDDLPKIDCVLLSHNHYDHLDVATLRRLVARDNPAIFCPLGVGKLLRRTGFTAIHEADWGDTVVWNGLPIHCVQAQHFAARTPFDRNRTLWCGWLIDGSAGEILFAGDSGFGPHYAELGAQFRRIRLAILPIGAYAPEWFMGPIHMTPEEALTAARQLGAETSMAIHFGTFSLADDSEFEPVERLRAAADASNRFWVLAGGEGRDVPPFAKA